MEFDGISEEETLDATDAPFTSWDADDAGGGGDDDGIRVELLGVVSTDVSVEASPIPRDAIFGGFTGLIRRISGECVWNEI